MPSLKSLKIRITSVKSTQKITKAMKMVAASKLRRAQEAVEAARPYAMRLERMLGSLGASVKDLPTAPKLLAGNGKDQVHLLVVATAERGLAGGFNTSIAKAARLHANNLLMAGKTVKIIFIGKKGRDAMRRDHGRYQIDFVDLRQVKRMNYAVAQPIAEKITDLFNAGEFDVCTIFFNKFKSVITQIPTAQQLIPAQLPVEVAGAVKPVYDFEPSEEGILEKLLPHNMAMQIYQALLENAASEQGARMSAMDSATRNAGEMINKLTLQYNRQRQAMITKELIEIISGAEAV